VAFFKQYEKLKQNKREEDPMYFVDAAHPQHNPVIACGWIKRGEDHVVRTNSGRQRVNINGAIDLDSLAPVVRFDDTINADSTIALFEQLERINLVATWIYVICDNARYYRHRAVNEYLKTSRIKLVSCHRMLQTTTSSSDYGSCSKRRRSTTVTLKPSPSSRPRVKRFSPIRQHTAGICARC
jgi:hypothetical protein